ncbi:TPA: hypothetical protein ACSKKP_002854 [Listeria innocua]
MTIYKEEMMSHYHQLLNQLNELNLSCMKENLAAHLDEVAKSDKSLVDSLFELTQQAHPTRN